MSNTHRVGWHLGNSRAMAKGDWSVIRSVPPSSVTFIGGESIGTEQLRRLFGISPHCHIFVRQYFRPSDKESDFRGYLDATKALITPGNWDIIPEAQRHLQIFNEPNMPHTAPVGHPTDQWEGFGPSVEAMERFNRWFCQAYRELKEVNPTWRIGFSPLTPGNKDAWFRTDPVNVPYYMHGPEAAHENPTDEEMAAAVESGPCHEALSLADEYLAHIYVINDAEHQMKELWCGLRFVQYARFFPKPLDIWITELGIGGFEGNWVKWYDLLDDYPAVKSTGIWRLGYEIRSGGEPLVKMLHNYTGGAVPDPIELTPPSPAPGPPAPPAPAPTEGRCLVGVCGRNDYTFREADYSLVENAKIELLKMMSFTHPEVFARLQPAKFIVRLYDDRMRVGHHPTPQEFVDAMTPIIGQLQSYATLFEIHNEPNHLVGIEGWGQEDHQARDFVGWFVEVYEKLKSRFGLLQFGFPGLAVPHRDLEWLGLCQDAIDLADWLGAHCYWQNPTYTEDNHLSDYWGLRFKEYHKHFPDKDIHITEFGNSNSDSGYPLYFDKTAKEHVEYFTRLFEYPYIKSASGFIMSAPQQAWKSFVWCNEFGHNKPVVEAVGKMFRPSTVGIPDEPETAPIQSLRNRAWQELAVPLNPDACFQGYARQKGLGVPLTGEIDMGPYRLQGFVEGIVFAKIGDWGKVSHFSW